MLAELIISIIAVILTFISYYLYVLSRAKEMAARAITDTEISCVNGEKGNEKLELAVQQVYELIPVTARMIIPKSVIKTIVQSTFDSIEEYAIRQIQKKSK